MKPYIIVCQMAEKVLVALQQTIKEYYQSIHNILQKPLDNPSQF